VLHTTLPKKELFFFKEKYKYYGKTFLKEYINKNSMDKPF